MARLKDDPSIYQLARQLLNENAGQDDERWQPVRDYVNDSRHWTRPKAHRASYLTVVSPDGERIDVDTWVQAAKIVHVHAKGLQKRLAGKHKVAFVYGWLVLRGGGALD